MNIEDLKIIETPKEIQEQASEAIQEFEEGVKAVEDDARKSMDEYLIEYAGSFENVVKKKVQTGRTVPLSYYFMDLKGEEKASPVGVEAVYAWHKMKGIQVTELGIDSMIVTGVDHTIQEDINKEISMVVCCVSMPVDDHFVYVVGLRTKDLTLLKSRKYRVRKSSKSDKKIVRFMSNQHTQSFLVRQGFEDLGYKIHQNFPPELYS